MEYCVCRERESRRGMEELHERKMETLRQFEEQAEAEEEKEIL